MRRCLGEARTGPSRSARPGWWRRCSTIAAAGCQGPGDPQLHSHALVLNKVRCEDGRWRTIDATELFHHKKSAGMIYQAALRNEMHQRLGVRFREVNENGQADIAGCRTSC